MTIATKISALLAAALLGLAFATAADGATIKVNCAKQNLQNKINAAPAGARLLIKGTCAGTFPIFTRLTLEGNPTATLDGNDAGAVLTIAGTAPVRLVRLRVVDGKAAVGGGIYVTASASLTLVHVTVSGNVADSYGGGIAAIDGAVILRNSSVTGNVAELHSIGGTVTGGGIRARSVRLTDSVVRGNSAHSIGTSVSTQAYGAGIYVSGGAVVATRSHIDGNTVRADGPGAQSQGGGIAQGFGGVFPMRLTRSTVSRNAAISSALGGSPPSSYGGAVVAGELVATRTNFLGNRVTVSNKVASAFGFGGAVYVNGERATLTGVRISNSRLNVAGVSTATGGAAQSFSGCRPEGSRSTAPRSSGTR